MASLSVALYCQQLAAESKQYTMEDITRSIKGYYKNKDSKRNNTVPEEYILSPEYAKDEFFTDLQARYATWLQAQGKIVETTTNDLR